MRAHLTTLACSIAALTAVGMQTLVAKAADLGGNCCSDLEERIAELEATAVRKGNRKVKLIISGQVARSVMMWDDGGEQNQYVGDGPSSTRFRFEGTAKISKDVTAGFLLELGASNNYVGSLDQETDSLNRRPDVNTSLWFIEHAKFGAVTVGFGQTATGDTMFTNLGGQDVAASPDVMGTGGNLVTRSAGIPGERGLNFSTNDGNISLRWRRLAPEIGSDDRNMVRYDSPEFFGFVASAAWGSDDFWDANLRYANLKNDIKFSAQAGYSRDTSERSRTVNWTPNGDQDQGNRGGDTDTGNTIVEEFQASASAWHQPSGIFVSGAYQWRHFEGTDAGVSNAICLNGPIAGASCENRPDFDYYWGSAGIRRKFTTYGYTSIFGEYATGLGGVEGLDVGVVTAQGGDIDFVTNSKVEVYGGGIVQRIDAAAMDIYVAARYYQADVSGLEKSGAKVKADIDDATVVITGARIKF